ncbi:MAG TPA: hypothetical protein VMX17_03045 [Candidatus Glassbacteria bacterium]|nr:hypothetical protein [Candidatus Glassbacteria bacterium]
MQNQDTTKFEFILTLEKNIVIQRFFNVNNYNPSSKNSIDLYDSVTSICEEIERDLKSKTLDVMNDNPEYATEEQRAEEIKNAKEENFILRIKLGDCVFISRLFPAHVYHPKVRYSVDIRPKVRKILGELTNVLSSKSLEETYLGYELK